jgi:hypothetical protein
MTARYQPPRAAATVVLISRMRSWRFRADMMSLFGAVTSLEVVHNKNVIELSVLHREGDA